MKVFQRIIAILFFKDRCFVCKVFPSPLGIQCVARIQEQLGKHGENAHPHFCVSVWFEAAVEKGHQLVQKLPNNRTYKINTNKSVTTNLKFFIFGFATVLLRKSATLPIFKCHSTVLELEFIVKSLNHLMFQKSNYLNTLCFSFQANIHFPCPQIITRTLVDWRDSDTECRGNETLYDKVFLYKHLLQQGRNSQCKFSYFHSCPHTYPTSLFTELYIVGYVCVCNP